MCITVILNLLEKLFINHSRACMVWFSLLRYWKPQNKSVTLRIKFKCNMHRPNYWLRNKFLLHLHPRKLPKASSSSSRYLSLVVCSTLMKSVSSFGRFHDRNFGFKAACEYAGVSYRQLLSRLLSRSTNKDNSENSELKTANMHE